MKPALFLLLIGSILFIPALVQAEEKSSISLKAEIDKAAITIGERVEYRVTITHEPSVQILSQIAPPQIHPFEVKEVHDFSEKQGKQIVEGRRFVLTTYELGEFILEPFSIQYRTGGGEPKTLRTNRLFITVRSVDTSDKPKTDIRNVKGTLELKHRWGWLGYLFLCLAGFGGGFYFWWQRKHRGQTEGPPEEPELSPEDQALFELNRLFDSDLLSRGKMKEYFFKLSEILRRYFERRFEMAAIESTTSEILRDLKIKELPLSLRQKIQDVLEVADWVKFAKWKPSPTEIVRTNQLAKALVEEARPKGSPAHGI